MSEELWHRGWGPSCLSSRPAWAPQLWPFPPDLVSLPSHLTSPPTPRAGWRHCVQVSPSWGRQKHVVVGQPPPSFQHKLYPSLYFTDLYGRWMIFDFLSPPFFLSKLKSSPACRKCSPKERRLFFLLTCCGRERAVQDRAEGGCRSGARHWSCQLLLLLQRSRRRILTPCLSVRDPLAQWPYH